MPNKLQNQLKTTITCYTNLWWEATQKGQKQGTIPGLEGLPKGKESPLLKKQAIMLHKQSVYRLDGMNDN